MFIIVKFGDDVSKVFNSDCRNINLLHCIRTKCGCNDNDEIDVCDENAVIKHLRLHLLESASGYCQDRETLILLRVERSKSNDVNYVPLLTELESDANFIERLNSRVTSRTKKHNHGSHDDDGHVTNGRQSVLRRTSLGSRKGQGAPRKAAASRMGSRLDNRH